MVSVDTVYKTVQTLINKENAGYVSPVEFNLMAKQVQDEIFREYFEDINRDRNKENRGLTNQGYANLSLNQRQKINQFSALSIVPISGISFPLPSELYLIEDNGVITANTGALPRVIEEVDRNQFGYLEVTEAAPTFTYPVYERFSDSIRVYPSTVDNVQIRYLRQPRNPKWTYLVVNGNELYDPSNVSFQNFELHESEFSNIVIRMMSLFGINLREDQVVAVAENMKQGEQLKTNN